MPSVAMPRQIAIQRMLFGAKPVIWFLIAVPSTNAPLPLRNAC